MNKKFRFIHIRFSSLVNLEIFILYIQNIKKVLKCKYKNVLDFWQSGERRQGTSKKCQEEEQVSGDLQRLMIRDQYNEKEDFI